MSTLLSGFAGKYIEPTAEERAERAKALTRGRCAYLNEDRSDSATAKIRRFLRANKGGLTANDLVARTGLRKDTIYSVLGTLRDRGEARVEPSVDGARYFAGRAHDPR